VFRPDLACFTLAATTRDLGTSKHIKQWNAVALTVQCTKETKLKLEFLFLDDNIMLQWTGLLIFQRNQYETQIPGVQALLA
jgi:hypothetical protein